MLLVLVAELSGPPSAYSLHTKGWSGGGGERENAYAWMTHHCLRTFNRVFKVIRNCIPTGFDSLCLLVVGRENLHTQKQWTLSAT